MSSRIPVLDQGMLDVETSCRIRARRQSSIFLFKSVLRKVCHDTRFVGRRTISLYRELHPHFLGIRIDKQTHPIDVRRVGIEIPRGHIW